jgi:hypothetical protein
VGGGDADIVKSNNVSMPQFRSGHGLATKSFGSLGITSKVRVKYLNRHNITYQESSRPINIAHAARSELCIYPVLAVERLSDKARRMLMRETLRHTGLYVSADRQILSAFLAEFIRISILATAFWTKHFLN